MSRLALAINGEMKQNLVTVIVRSRDDNARVALRFCYCANERRNAAIHDYERIASVVRKRRKWYGIRRYARQNAE